MLNLSECKVNKNYVIKKIEIKNRQVLSRLADFVISENQKIKFIAKCFGNGAFLISVNEIEYAIDFLIANHITVEAI
ncbi:MAG: ferrous iron transport protein A [Clostridia bacterium]|nr:ferrous iron transport protein A [Clostridia bacterium]